LYTYGARCAVAAALFGPGALYAAKPSTTAGAETTRVQHTTAGLQRSDAAGAVRAMYRIAAAPSSLPAEETARGFLRSEFSGLAGHFPAAELVTTQVLESPGGTHVRFHQYFDGIPVLDADVVVSLDREGRVVMAVNNMEEPPPALTTTPAFPAQEAIARVKNALQVSGPAIGREPGADLAAWLSEAGRWHLVYRVLMTTEQPYGDWEVLLDAATGEVLRTIDRFVMHAGESSSVTAAVYLPDPLSSARRMYGSPGFADNNDADTDSLNAARSLVQLDSLTVTDGFINLSGPWCSITDIESPAATGPYGAPASAGFVVTRSDRMFEAVNAYHHAAQAARHVEALGFALPGLRGLRLDPHGFQGQDNSHYSPSGHWIGFGEGGVDDAEDADIIWHEYGHAVIFTIVPTWGGGESGALGEGISDYWAASASRESDLWSPADYHYQWLFNWDGHNPFWAGRILNDARVYPFGALPIHTAGQIVSAALMGIRNELGRTVTDRLVLKALMYLGARATAADFGYAMIQADEDMYDGVHCGVIAHWLGTVKKFIDPAPFVLAADETPSLPVGFTLGRNYPNPFNPSTTIPFRLDRSGTVTMQIVDMTGREVARPVEGFMSAGDHTARWDAVNMASGVYMVILHQRTGEGPGVRSQARSILLLK
jgi:hypothetical protein